MHTNYVSYATATIILAMQIAHEFGLEIQILLMDIQIQSGWGTNDC